MATIPRYKDGPYGPSGGVTQPGVAAPANLRSTAITSSSISLAWNAAASSTFTLERAPVTNGVVGSYAVVSSAITGKTYQDTGLTASFTYAYRVKVTVNGVTSPYSNVVQVTTAAATAQPLAAPQLNPPTNITSGGFTISWAAVPNANSYRVRLDNSTLFMPGNVLAYSFTGLPASSSHTADVQALDNTNAYAASPYSNVVQATTAASGGQPIVFTPQSSEFRWNKRNDTMSVAAGYVLRDGLAAWGKAHNASSFKFKLKTSYDSQYLVDAVANVYNLDGQGNWVFFQSYAPTQSNVEQEFVVSGIPAGVQGSAIYEAGSYRGGEQGLVEVVNVTQVTFPAGTTVSDLTYPTATEAVVAFGNSRSVGGGVIDSPRYAFLRELGRVRGADVYLTGYASLQMGAHILASAGQTQQVSELKQRVVGYPKPRYVLGPDTENDWSYNTYTPAQLQTAYQQTITKVQADSQVGGTKIYIATTFQQKSGWGPANGLGFTQQDYYNMEKGIAAGFSNCYTLDFMAAGLTAADYADDSHLNPSGENKLRIYTASVFDASDSGGTTPPPTNIIDFQDFEGLTALPNSYTPSSAFTVGNYGHSTSGTNSLRMNTSGVGVLTGPTAVRGDGLFKANVLPITPAGNSYVHLYFCYTKNGTQESYYSLVVSENSDGIREFYFRRTENNTTQEFFSPPIRVQSSSGFLSPQVQVIRPVSGPLTINVYMQSLDNGNWLDPSTGFTQPTRAAVGTYTDNNPLPAGLSQFACYVDTPGNAIYIDDADLEKNP